MIYTNLLAKIGKSFQTNLFFIGKSSEIFLILFGFVNVSEKLAFKLKKVC